MLVVFAQMTVMLSSMNIMFSRIRLFAICLHNFVSLKPHLWSSKLISKHSWRFCNNSWLVKYKTKQFSSDHDIAMQGEIKTTFNCDHKTDVISRLFFMILFLTSRQMRFY